MGYFGGTSAGYPTSREEFGNAADELRALGYHIINPAEICQVIPNDQLSYEVIMQIDLVLLEKADYLVQLPDWEESRGANRELGFALGTDKIVVTYEALIGGRCHDIERDL